MTRIEVKSVGIDIGKRRCIVCIMNEDGFIVERTGYDNTLEDARKFAQKIRQKYGKCNAACESTGNMWTKTIEAFEKQKIPIKLANTFKMKIISETTVDGNVSNSARLTQT